MKTIIEKIFIVSVLLLATASCSDFLDVNDDPDNPSATAPKYMLPAVLGNSATLTFNAGDFSIYYSQQLATQSGNDRTRDRWEFSGETRVGIFRNHYFDVGGNALNLIDGSAKEAIYVNYLAAGKIMLAYAFLTSTDVLGDMPFDEAFSGKDSPKYDTQERVYEGIGQLLDEGIQYAGQAIEATDLSPMTAVEDPVFGGNMLAWKAFAHGLKARWLNHQSNRGADLSQVVAQADLALQNWVAAKYPYTGENEWQQNSWGPKRARPLTYSMRPNYLASSAPVTFFLNLMKDEDILDPRAPLHFGPNESGEILSVESGVGRGAVPQDDMPDLLDMALTKDTSALHYMTEAELYFIKAEASFADKTTAYSSYLAGITSDMNRLGVSTEAQDEYLNNPDFVAQSPGELTLSHIMVQKFIAMYLHPEAWVDMRRHDWSTEIYPGLVRPANVDETIFGGDKWIARVPYNMETEYIYNLPEIDRLGAKDPAFLAVKLWWMKQ